MAADKVVCPFFVVVFERLNSLIDSVQSKEIGPLGGLVKELNKLFESFLKIKEVLDDAEEKQFNKKAERVRYWLQELNDAAYEADDVFDEFEYEALQQAEGASNNNKKRRRQRIRRKIEKLIQTFDEKAKKCSGLDLQRGKEKSVVVSPITMSLLAEPQVYGREEDREKLVEQLLGSAYEKLVASPITYKHPPGIRGAVQNKASSSNQGNISVFPILGMGGLGKTTLAQLVYNDKRVKNHFKVRSWVCVSDDFDIKRFVKAFVASVSGSECNLEDIELLQRSLRKKVHGKRFLLVLDDVWEERQDEWNKMMNFFEGGAQGSSIIVTTRLQTVASIASALPPHRLDSLSKRDCWDLFKQYAFGPGNEERPALVKIGKKIIKKCHGLPLAAKALGSLLRFKSDENEWLSIKDSAIWDFENTILPALRLSYYHLSFRLKQCFVYCSIFPKDHKIEKERLIRLWMANGLVQSRAKIDLEDVGSAIFNELLWRSFFQDIEKDEDGNIISCKMHDLVHDLASHIAGDEYFVKDFESSRSPKKTRHVFLQYEYGDNSSSIFESMQRSSPCLRSLIWSYGYHVTLDSKFLLSDLAFLRALDLDNHRIEVVPDCIGELKHLRYLNLSNNAFTSLPESICLLSNIQTLSLSWCTDLSSLPESICLLRHMQTLSLRGCRKLSSLPEHIENMRSLVHLDIERCDRLTSMPIGIGQLTFLRTLPMFILGKESGIAVDGLQKLNNLRGELRIDGLHGVETFTEAKEANLMSKKNIHSLKLCWTWVPDSHSDSDSHSDADDSDLDSRQQRHQNVIEGLQPHSNLRKLKVIGYQGVTLSPSWLTEASLLPNLVEVRLSRCTCEHLGSLKKLPSLKVLKLVQMDSLKFIEVDDSPGGFLSLEELSLDAMPNLEGWSWSSSQEASAEEVFRWLEELRLEEPMRYLEGSSSSQAAATTTPTSTPAAAVFPHLKSKSAKKFERSSKLKIGEAPSSLSPSLLSQAPTSAAAVFPCLKKVRLRECPKLKGVPLAWSPVEDVDIFGNHNGMVLGSLRDLPSLPSLRITWFDIKYFPSGTLSTLTALHKLEIEGFYNLKSLPVKLYSLATLTELRISTCRNLVSLADEREGGLKNPSSLKTLFIYDCVALKGLPELEHLVVLESLELIELPKLTCFPEGIKHSAAKLRHLQFRPSYRCGAEVDLPDWIGSLTSLEYLEIDAPEDWNELPQWMRHLADLKQLKIYGCYKVLGGRMWHSDEQRENNNFNMISHVPDVDLSEWYIDPWELQSEMYFLNKD